MVHCVAFSPLLMNTCTVVVQIWNKLSLPLRATPHLHHFIKQVHDLQNCSTSSWVRLAFNGVCHSTITTTTLWRLKHTGRALTHWQLSHHLLCQQVTTAIPSLLNSCTVPLYESTVFLKACFITTTADIGPWKHLNCQARAGHLCTV